MKKIFLLFMLLSLNSGLIIGQPVISISPQYYDEALACNDSLTIPFLISNLGSSNLTWSVVNNTSFSDDFDPYYDAALWTSVTGGSSNTNCGSVSGYALMFNGTGTREAVTKDLYTVNVSTVNFYLKISNTSSSTCETADSGEEIVIEYSNTGGSSWTNIATYNVTLYPNFTSVNQALPAGAKTSSTRFRWRQLSNSGSSFDHWALDNVTITGTGFLTPSPVSGTAYPSGTSVVNLTFSSVGLTAGTYYSSFSVNSNDAANPTITVPCTLTVSGPAAMALSDTCINFGSIFQGATATDTLSVTNSGCSSLQVTGITVTPSGTFSASPSTFTVLADSTVKVLVSFSPGAIAGYSGNLNISSSIGSQSVCLTGSGSTAPDIEVNPDTLNITVTNCGDSISVPLVISNTGGADLYINMDGGGGGMVEVLALTYGVDYAQEYTNTITAISQYFSNYNLTEVNTTSGSVLQTALAGKDVVLLPEMETGTASYFTNFASVLQSFVTNGGTVIFCGSAVSSAQSIFNTGLLTGTYMSTTYSTTMNVINNTHPITVGLPSTITSADATVYLNITNSAKVQLVTYTGYDVVTYVPYGAGNVIYVGYDFYAYDSSAAKIIAHSVEWGGNGSLPAWLTLSSNSDTILSGDSAVINVMINTAGMNGGTYTGEIVINSNDPDENPLTVPVTLTIVGTPAMVLSDTCYNFGNIMQGATVTDTLLVTNTGCANLQVTGITAVPSGTFGASPYSFSVLPDSTMAVIVYFSPGAIASYSGNLTISTNAGNQTVCLSGTGTSAPDISLTQTSLNVTLGCEDSTTVPFVIGNAGGGSLSWTITPPTSFSDDFDPGINTAMWLETTGGAANTLCGSVSGNALMFNATGTRQAVTINLNTIAVGAISFSFKISGGTPSTCEQADAGEDVVLEYSVNNGISYTNIATYAYNLYPNFTLINQTLPSGAKTASTRFRWRQLSNSGSCCDHWALDNVSITGAGFISVTPLAGTTVGYDSSTVNVEFNSSGLNAGTYYGNLSITSNDPDENPVVVPCTLTVVGTPVMVLSDTCLNYGNVFEGATVTDTLKVTNSGCGNLQITGISLTPSANFSSSLTSFTLLPDNSINLLVSFTPSAVTGYSGTLTFTGNLSTQTVCLTGTGTSAPDIYVNPDTLNITINGCDDSTSVPLVIGNSGGTDLYLDIEAGSGGFVEVLALTYGVDTIQEYANTINAINQYFGNYNLTEVNTTSASVLQTALAGKDVLLLAEMENGTASYFTGFASVLQSFVTNGGTVIFCGTANSSAQSIFNTGLLTGTYVSTTYATSMTVLDNTHPITTGLPSTITSQDATMYMNITNSAKVMLVSYTGYDVVTYVPNGSGKVIFVGYDFYAYDSSAAKIIAHSVEWGGNGSLPPWLTLSSTTDTVSAGSTTFVNVTANSSGLAAGQYTTEIIINSNDPNENPLTVPVNLTVVGSPAVGLSDTCIYFGNVFQGATATDTLIVTNTGCADLQVTGVSAIPSGAFSASPGNFTLAPDSSMNVIVYFTAASVASYSGNLTITTNAGTKTVCLSGAGVVAPDIAVSQTSVSISLSCSDSVMIPLMISNTGGSNLTWDITPPTSFYDDFDPAVNASMWLDTTGGSSNVLCGSVSGNALMFNGASTRQAVTVNLNTLGVSVIDFYFKISGGTPSTCEQADAGEDVVLEYSINNGASWTNITTYAYNLYPNFTLINQTIPSGAKTASTRFRWRQLSNSGNCCDHWALDNVSINGASFLSISPLSGNLVAADSSVVFLTFNSSGLNGGQYINNITINSNDPNENPLTVACTLNVSYNPCADFYISNNSSCTGTVSFKDTTSNSPTSWTWNFGDGSTSTQQNPIHVYPVSGTFPVQLIACNGYGCDTAVQNVVVLNTGGPAATCSVSTTSYCCGIGIYNVSLSSINNTSSDGVDGYMDYSCSYSTSLTEGQSYSIAVQTGASYNENVKVYIDFNNNAVFDTISELVFNSQNMLINHSGTISVPSTAVMNTALRMRVMSDYYSQTMSPCLSVTYGQVEDYAVVVVPDAAPPVASFTSAVPSACQGTAVFTDNSINIPTTWAWNFGDGSTSTQQNPTHIYSAAGTYTVTLNACNAYGCDTMQQSVVISNIGTVISACTPVTTGYCCGMGIYNVSFSSINNSSIGGSEGYMDFSCSVAATVTMGQSYTFSVETGPTVNENVRAWIDYNNDGTFSTGEQIISSNNLLQYHSANVVISALAVANTPLRLRIGSDYFSSPAPSPCTDAVYGQFEDYAITIIPANTPPVANFSYTLTDTCNGEVQFTDNSSNGPTSWSWQFGDGSNSTLQNPVHTYGSGGTYSISLIATNAFGADTMITYVTVSALSVSFSAAGTFGEGDAVNFTGLSPDAVSWFWIFGDGSTSTVPSPNHVFDSAGIYMVTLTVTDALGCTASATQNIIIFPTGINKAGEDFNLWVRPNPNKGKFMLALSGNNLSSKTITVVDVLGQTVFKIENTSEQQLEIDLGNVGAGVYFVKVESQGKIWIKNVIVE